MKPKNKTRISVKEFVAQTQDTNQTQTADPNNTTGGTQVCLHHWLPTGCCPCCRRGWYTWQWPFIPYQIWPWITTGSTVNNAKDGSTFSIN